VNHRLIPLVAAFLALLVVYFVGVVFFFEPILAADQPGGALVHPAIALLLTTLSFIAFFEWVRRHMRSVVKAAIAVAVPQFLLVNFDYVLTGKRGLATAGASTVLLFTGWAAAALAYRAVATRSRPEDGEDR
jgi:O-antigen/teichoic acid export membrane protein